MGADIRRSGPRRRVLRAAVLGLAASASTGSVSGFRAVASTPRLSGYTHPRVGGGKTLSSPYSAGSRRSGMGAGSLLSSPDLASSRKQSWAVAGAVANSRRRRQRVPQGWQAKVRGSKGEGFAEAFSQRLSEGLSYLTADELREIQLALSVALYAHSNSAQARARVKAGVDLCLILGELEMDLESLLGALLSGVLNTDTTAARGFGRATITAADIEETFGKGVADLVESFERVSLLEEKAQGVQSLREGANRSAATVSFARRQADKLRNLILSEALDARVVVLLVASHLQALKAALKSGATRPEQIALAHKALQVDAPFAHRMGIHQLRCELENLAFKHLYPRQYALVQRLRKEHMGTFDAVLMRTTADVTRALEHDKEFIAQTESVSLHGRMKEPYSMWRKMLKQKVGVAGVSDAMALRIVCKARWRRGDTEASYKARSEALCYQAMEVVQGLYPHVEDRQKDYIQWPKPNGYQSLHSTVLVDGARDEAASLYPFEIQARTMEMHQHAEFGLAAHWSYKGEGTLEEYEWLNLSTGPNERPKAQGRARHVKRGRRDTHKAEVPPMGSGHELMTWLSKELHRRKVFVFGPDGLIWDLDKASATAANVMRKVSHGAMAYGRSACVNGQVVPLHHKLKNGDIFTLA